MDSNWLMPTGSDRAEGCNEGSRPSGTVLMALIDQSDASFPSVVSVLHEMRSAGIELNEHIVKAAIAMGRNRHRGANRQDGESPNSWDAPADGAIVYYIRRANLVKIGTTKRPYNRFAALLPDEILAWEPGTHPVERSRHRQFADWRVGGSEYFRANEALRLHTEQLRRLHGAPDPDWPTFADVAAIRTKHLDPLSPSGDATLVTVIEGVEALGIKRNTVDMWVRRRLLIPAGTNGRGRPVYLLAHMNELAERSGLLPDAA